MVALLVVTQGPILRPKAVAAEANMTTVYLVLKKGPAWTAEETPATKAIQEAPWRTSARCGKHRN